MDDILRVGTIWDQGGPCHKLVQVLTQVCMEFGVPLAEEKSVGPTTHLTFLGLELDSVFM